MKIELNKEQTSLLLVALGQAIAWNTFMDNLSPDTERLFDIAKIKELAKYVNGAYINSTTPEDMNKLTKEIDKEAKKTGRIEDLGTVPFDNLEEFYDKNNG